MCRPLMAVFVFAAAALPLSAQTYADLSGYILDPTGAAVFGAALNVVNEETGFRRATWSQPEGAYVVASLQPGIYKITVRKLGFRTIVRFGVKLDIAKATRLDFTLPVGEITESITVAGDAPALNSDDASVGTLITRDRMERLPLNGRGLLSLLELAPGTVVTPATRGEAGQFAANGQRPNTHYFTVDGVSVNTGVSGGGLAAQCTGGSLPNMTAFGSFHSAVSLDAMDEFRIQTSTATPGFGRLPGAQVSISSRSGSNDFHGSVFHYFRHEDLAANDWFVNSQGMDRAPLRLNHLGGTAGGPLRRDRTFFFAAYEGMRLRQPFAWMAAVPSPELRREVPPGWARDLLSLYPEVSGPEISPGLSVWSGSNQRPARLDAASLRLDSAITSRLNLFAHFRQAPSSAEFGAAQINRLMLRSRIFTAGLDLRIRPGFAIDLRFNRSSAAADSVWTPQSPIDFESCDSGPYSLCDKLVRFSVSGAGRVSSGHEGRRQQGQWQGLATANAALGAHQLRFGFDYRRLDPRFRDASDTLSIMAETATDLLDTRYLWIATSPSSSGRTISTEFAVFLQDTWRISPSATLTYGARWEISPPPLADPPAYFFDPATGLFDAQQRAIWPAQYGNIAPRVGIAWRPGQGRTVLRAGSGVFYASTLSIATDLVNGGPFNIQQFQSGRTAPFSSLLSYGFLPEFRLPAVIHWSGSLERAFSGRDVGSLTYAGAAGRRLIRREIGGPGNTETVRVALATNHGRSDYHSLQAQYRRRLAVGFEAMAAYTWSHSLDNSSSDAILHWVAEDITPRGDWASSDFDVRHTATAALSYEFSGAAPRWLRGWWVDGILRARAGFPVDVINTENTIGLTFANVFRPDLVGGQPLWINDRGAPGGRRLNAAAFQARTGFEQGTLGRNAISGFGMSQVDVAVRREFSLRERATLHVRIEAFNALNQANFADPTRYLASPLFGSSPSMLNVMLGTGSPGSGLTPMFQTGGPRSVQASLRLIF